MRIFKLIYVLFKMHLLSPWSIYRLIKAIYKYGINVMVLLYFAERTYGNKVALIDDHGTYSYKDLLSEVEKLSMVLKTKYDFKSGQKVGFLCRNHIAFMEAFFACSRLGLHLYLLNADMGINQLNHILSNHEFDMIIYDDALDELVNQSTYSKIKIISYHDEKTAAINHLIKEKINNQVKLKRSSKSNIILLSGGTTGHFKELEHKPSLFNYLNPFIEVVMKLKLLTYNSFYTAPPLYHADGLASVFLSIILGKKTILTEKFKADKACQLIREHQVEAINVVPVMLERMLDYKPNDLKSLQCIISGAAKLDPVLIEKVFNQLGDIIYNLYGTTETGTTMIATPKDLRYSPHTIGKKIKGVHLKILDDNKKEVPVNKVGQFCIKTKWSMKNTKDKYIGTGDLGYKDENGYYFLRGRADDMIVSGGENVYPVELEEIIIKHPEVEDVAIIGVSDEKFGQRLVAFVLMKTQSTITKEELLTWIKQNVARYQMPRDLIFLDKMPYTSIGKHDKKQLKNLM